MNSIFIIIPALFLFALGYRFYGGVIERLFGIDKNRPTPAKRLNDGIDYVPAKNSLVLFGHHFASIAGAGPIIGPVIALTLWGWLPAVLWVVLGTIFIGGVHDFSALMVSVRHEGRSIADVSEEIISKRARIIFSIFVLLALILVVAVFIYFCAKTFVDEPKVVSPSLGLIPVAMLIGFLIYKRNLNIVYATGLGLVCLFCLMLLGEFAPIMIGANAMLKWSLILIVYCFFASIMPVNILLQPRDYLSSFLLFFTILVGVSSIVISQPVIAQSAVIAYNTSSGPMWPMLFVVVACGAISGFHSLIAGGTSSKQLSSEAHAKAIGYGAMVVEGVVALMAVIVVGSLTGFDKTINLAALIKDIGPVGLFGKGFGAVSEVVVGRFGIFIAITTLNAFILTTLDTGTRIARYILEELTSIKNKYLSTAIILLPASFLALSGKWSKLWPAFGASNQLVAALTLLVISCWLLAKGKPARYVLIPACLMLVTTIAALILGIINYIRSADYLLLVISVFLIALALILSFESYKVIMKRKRIKCVN
ncbi:MAG: carbon starvation protein A [Candidatus Omnitrophica bacterium]|nr:carbon starvation protein A [Candidatus Omnitrophota bacterium]